MQKGFGKREAIEVVSMKIKARDSEKYIRLRELLLQDTLDIKISKSSAKPSTKCRSSEARRSAQKVIQKMIPIREKTLSQTKTGTPQSSTVKYRSLSTFTRPDQVQADSPAAVEEKRGRIQSYKVIKKYRVNVMNLQLVPGEEPAMQIQNQDNRMKDMIQKRRMESSLEKEKQKQRFRLACSTLLQNKYLKLSNQQFQHNNRFVKHILETLKCSRIQTESQEQPTKNMASQQRRQIASRESVQLTRPKTQYHTSKLDRKGSSSVLRKASAMNLKKMVFYMGDFSADKIYKKKIQAYVDFLYKINFSNMVYVELRLKEECDQQTPKVRVYVGKGNNNKLVKSLIRRRFWMELVDQNSKGVNFYWTQSKLKHIHVLQDEHKVGDAAYKQKLQLYKLPKNPRSEDNQKILSKTQSRIVENYLVQCSHQRSLFPRFQPAVVTNHIPQNSLIGSKKALFHSLQHYYQHILLLDPFDYIPLTFHIKSGSDDAYKTFQQHIRHEPRDKVWIVKPGENSNRGNGISLAYAHQISVLLSRKNSSKTSHTYIIQSYINKPFLYNNRKFDIRHYLLITSVNGILKAYFYQDGYIRTSSQAFDIQDIDNKYIHLTNDAIQKYGQDYGKYEPGNKISYNEFQRHLDMVYPAKKYSFQSIVGKMKDLAIDAVKANFINMDSKRKLNNFEVYGMDFMIDSNFKPWLIQINANPCLEISCPLLSRIIPPLIQNTLRLGLDPLFPPSHHYPISKRFELGDNFLANLRYQLIFDQRLQRTSMLKKIEEAKSQLQIMDDLSDFQDEYQDEGQEVEQIQC